MYRMRGSEKMNDFCKRAAAVLLVLPLCLLGACGAGQTPQASVDSASLATDGEETREEMPQDTSGRVENMQPDETAQTLVSTETTAPQGSQAVQRVYYYVNSETGNDTADGTSAASAVKTFTRACALAAGARAQAAAIVITNEYHFSSTFSEPAHAVPFTVTASDGTTDYGASGAKLVFGNALRYMLAGETSFERITVEYTGTLNFVANYNPITFGEAVVMRGAGGENGVYVVGGYQSPTDKVDTSLDSHITIRSGTFLIVAGGSRDKADGVNGNLYKICTFTGTHHIEVSGGQIGTLYGASLRTHYSQSAKITVSGGQIGALYVGGDLSRRLNGDAAVTLSGGSVGALYVNNVVGSAVISLCGATVGAASVSCYNEEVQKLETAADKPKILNYDANRYTAAQIEKLGAGFDAVNNVASVYAGAPANGTGLSAADPAPFDAAFARAAETGGTLVIVGSAAISNFTEPSHSEKVVIRGLDASARLQISGRYTLSGETEFSDIALGGGGTVCAENGRFIASDGVKTDGTLCITGSAALYSGSFDRITDALDVLIDGAEVESVTGGCGNAVIEVVSGSAGTIKSTDTEIERFSVTVNGGSVGRIVFYNVKTELICQLYGGTVLSYEASGNNARGTIKLDESKFSLADLGIAAELFTVSTEKVYYLRDGGNGNGGSVNSAGGSLDAAYAALSEQGGTVVLCGEYTLSSAFTGHTNTGKITITSVYGGVDYAKTSGAALIFKSNFYCGGDTQFSDITLKSAGTYLSIFAGGPAQVLGENITCEIVGEGTTQLSVMGGTRNAMLNTSSHVTIQSGIWQRVRGGTAASGSRNYTVELTITGGSFIERLTLGSSGSHDGDIRADISGGTFYQGIYASTLSSAAETFNSHVTLTITGGTFYAKIAAAASTAGTYRGSFDVSVFGGEFAHLTDLLGTADLGGGMTSSLTSTIDLSAAETGTMTFKNPVRQDGADPWLFYHDGYYYYTSTTGSASLKLVRVANIGDLPYASGTTIYTPAAGQGYSASTWSPEIHYYTDAEVGEGNGGWYCYFGGDSGTDAAVVNHRMYVLKCLDGDNLLGRWGNPVTGEVNVPQRVEARDIADFDSVWAAGQSDIRIGGKLYMTYVTEVGRGTADFHQTINIVEMTNPWTIVGQPSVICVPEYDWEMGGYAYNPATGHWSPKVVEGATAVYGDDGSVYIVYSGSNYSTTEYKLGQLKYLGGDPLDKNNWEKLPTPILSKSDKVNGCGHACYVTDTDGQGWICYNGYLGKDANGIRYAFVEPYTADQSGVTIGNGSTHPEDPDTVYTVKVNPRSLADKITGFHSVMDSEK